METNKKLKGAYGPNDFGYINNLLREAAKKLVGCTYIWSEGHYPHSNARVMPASHPLKRALDCLAEVDLETAEYANVEHQPELFQEHKPSEQAQHRWDRNNALERKNIQA